MDSLILSFEDVYKRVSDFLGLSTSPAGTNLTKVKDITYRAYRKFLFPYNPQTRQIYVWSFLRRTGLIKTVINKYDYKLSDDFVGLVSGFKFDAGENKDNPQRIDISKFRALRSISVTTGTPEYYSIIASPYHTDTGASYEVWFYKTPDAVYTYKYEYIFDPPKPSATTDIFVGGVRGSEVIMQLALAIAELQEDDMAGPQNDKADMMLAAFIAYDQQYIPNAIEDDPDLTQSIPNFRRDALLRSLQPPVAGGQRG
jgi:hypothetical protein